MGSSSRIKCKRGEFLMAEYLTNDTDLKTVADAIRAKGKTTDALSYPDGFVTAIGAISGEDHTAEDGILDGSFEGVYKNPRITVLRGGAFSNCRKLTKIILDNVETVGDENGGDLAMRCVALTEIRLPKVKNMYLSINPNVIDFSGYLKTIYMPEVETISGSCFSELYGLEYLNFNKVKTIGSNAFQSCVNLKKLIIRTNEVCSINRWTMSGSLFEDKASEAYIYVPRALVEQYKAHQYWSVYADKIRAIEDFPEITGG